MTRRALLKLVFRSLKSNSGSGHELDLARGSVTCLGDFDIKMYIIEKLFDITHGLKTILRRGLNVKGLGNEFEKLGEHQK